VSQQQPEPWLRGTLAGTPPAQRAVLHALQLAGEDIARWCAPLSTAQMHARPLQLPSVAFHLRHVAGSLDRLLTYAEGYPLSEMQRTALDAEHAGTGTSETLLSAFNLGLETAAARILAIPLADWDQPRPVGRSRLPATVAGLLIHCADHTQRHAGQAITTAKVVQALAAGAAGVA
jgi:uncharacterized damage-inducible protein DinB